MRHTTNWTGMLRLLLVACVVAASGGCGLYKTNSSPGTGGATGADASSPTGGTVGTGGATGDGGSVATGTGGTDLTGAGGTDLTGAGGATTGAGGSIVTGEGGTGLTGAGGATTGAGGSVGTGTGGIGTTGAGGSGGICNNPGAVPVAAGKPTGNPILPPRWAFGTLWGTYADEVNLAGYGNVVADATRLRQDYEGDLFWIDSSWLWRSYTSDGSQYICFKFDPMAFPTPATMISQLNQMNFHFGVWEWPWMGHGCDLYSTALSNRYFVMNGNLAASTKSPWHGDGNASAFDFTNPATVTWWQGPGLNGDLAKIGFEFFKLDTTSAQQAEAFNSGGKAFNPTENYTQQYRLAAYQMSQKAALGLSPIAKVVGSARGIVMGKAAAPGSDQYPGWWTDDQSATWGGWANEISAAARLNTTTTAAYWCGDTGGYNGRPSNELYIRWAEYTAFTPLQEYFSSKTSGFGNAYPWNFSAQAQQIIETYNQLRYRLLPFRYNNAQAAYHAAAGSSPIPSRGRTGARICWSAMVPTPCSCISCRRKARRRRASRCRRAPGSIGGRTSRLRAPLPTSQQPSIRNRSSCARDRSSR